ncbi:MAG: DoxX family membrane protein [Verrucomicrobia bacterium]|nr:MAG: DoxX family membrane protein [Verrucomicrobiota bacterium]
MASPPVINEPKPSISNIVAVACAVALGAWFVYSGGAKIWVAGLDRFTTEIANYRLLKAPLDAVLAYTLPWAEIAGGLCLMAGVWRRGAILWIASLVVLFSGAVGWAWFHQLDIRCGCHGSDAMLDYPWKAAELLGYLVVLGFLWHFFAKPESIKTPTIS